MSYEKKKLEEPLTDESLMPSGKWKGTKMTNIPADYLMYVYDNDMCNRQVREYIESNLDVIKEEIKRENKNRNND